MRYTVLAACNINGIMLDVCTETQESNQGASGTIPPVVRAKLIPTFGRYDRDEPCSAVVLDNAPTHMEPTIGQDIRSAGALVIFTAAFFPDVCHIQSLH